MPIRVKFVELGEHAKVKIVDSGEDMEVLAVQGGEDLRVKSVQSGETFKVKVVRSTVSSLISYASYHPEGASSDIPDFNSIRVFRPLSSDVKKIA